VSEAGSDGAAAAPASGSASGSAIHDLGYKRYLGTRRPQSSRWRVIVRDQVGVTWRGFWRMKAWVIASAMTTVVFGALMFVFGNETFSAAVKQATGSTPTIVDAMLPFSFQFFPWFGFVMSVSVAAAVVPRDLKAGAFEFYFSRPVRPIDYVAGKLAGLCLIFAAVMAAGPLLLALFRVGISPPSEMLGMLHVVPRALLVGVLSTTAYAALPMAIGALAGSARTAVAVWVLFYLVVSGIVISVSHAVDQPDLGALSLPVAVVALAYDLFDMQIGVRLGRGRLAVRLHGPRGRRRLVAGEAGRARRPGRRLMAGPVLEISGCSKWYGHVLGVSEVSWTVRGGIVGLLGPNGAGKSTLMKMAVGLIAPSRGRLGVFGASPFDDRAVRARIGYCPEHENMWDELTAIEHVTALAELSGLPRKGARAAAARALAEVGMDKASHRGIKGFSKGMRQRTKLAGALVHDPDLLVLDEPLTGVDPIARAEIIARIRALGEAGKTVIVSSHVLYEIEALTAEIVVIYRGQKLAEGNVYEIRTLIDKHPHRIRVECDRPRDLGADLIGEAHVLRIGFERGAVVVETAEPDRCYDAIAASVLDRGVAVRSLTSPDNNLGAVFDYLTGGRP
jgi:ABC-2 type transport system ATP-binding protein